MFVKTILFTALLFVIVNANATHDENRDWANCSAGICYQDYTSWVKSIKPGQYPVVKYVSTYEEVASACHASIHDYIDPPSLFCTRQCWRYANYGDPRYGGSGGMRDQCTWGAFTIESYQFPPEGTCGPDEDYVGPGQCAPKSVPGKSKDELRQAKNSCETARDSAYGNPCDAATGHKYQTETDYRGAKGALKLNRHYNSNNAAKDSSFGFGWSSMFSHRRIEAADPYLQLWEGTGRGEPFENVNGQWQADADSSYQLTETASGYTLVDDDGNTSLFDTDGKLLSETDRQGRTTSYAYDSSGRVTSVTGPFGHALSFTYDSSNHITAATTPDGETLAYSYANGNLTRVTYADGSFKQYHYENTSFPHHLTGITDGNGNRFATYAYDANGKAILTEHAGGQERFTLVYDSDTQTTVTDAAGTIEVMQFGETLGLKNLVSKVNQSDGKSVSQSFDASNNLINRIDSEGRVTAYTYNASNQRTSMTEAVGTPQERTTEYEYLSADLDLPTVIRVPSVFAGQKKTTAITYDSTNNPVAVTQSGFTATGAAVSRSVAMQYNAFGQVTRIDGPRTDVNDITTLTYYECATGAGCGQLKSITNALGQTTGFNQYDANGRILGMTGPNGLATTYQYDARGRVVSIVQSGTGIATRVTQLQYDAAGQLVKSTDSVGAEISYGYNAAHELVSVTDSLGNKVVYSYDSRGNRVSDATQDPDGSVARSVGRVFDARNRAIQINAGGSVFKQAFDGVGNLLSETDPNNNPATTYSHDALNRLLATIDRLGGTSQYGYDVADRISEATAPNGAKTTYAYDDLGNKLSEQSPDRGLTSYQYDAAGNVSNLTDARGITVVYAYDALNRVAKVDYPGTDEDVTLAYDTCSGGVGRLCRATDSGGETVFTYDSLGNVFSESRTELGITYTTAYTYDNGNRVSTITYPDGRIVSYARDVLGRITSITTDINGTSTAIVSERTYRADHQLLSQRFGNGLVEARAYDERGQLGNQYIGSLDMRIYQYDANGNMIARQTTSELVNYGFDALDRLTNETAGTDLQTYTYDANGNRLSDLKTNGNVRSYVYDPNTNRLTLRGNGVVVLDAVGNILSDRNGKRSFVYNNAGRMQQFSKNGALKASYIYDYRQLRIRKVKIRADGSSKTFVYHYDLDGRLIAETREDGKLIRAYLWAGSQPVAQLKRKGNQGEVILTYIHSDHLDTPRLGTDSTQTLVWRWDAEAFGKGKPETDPDADESKVNIRLRFPGQYHDGESGLYYNWNRYYDPKTGRYITSDPIGLDGGLNTYGYVFNNPLRYDDPEGLEVRLMCRYVTGLEALGQKHCFVVVSCPEEGWSNILSLFSTETFNNIPIKGRKSLSTLSDPGRIDDPNSPNNTDNILVNPPKPNCGVCAYEKSVMERFNSFPAGNVPYWMTGPNSNSFAGGLLGGNVPQVDNAPGIGLSGSWPSSWR